jgi:hypothetical protein
MIVYPILERDELLLLLAEEGAVALASVVPFAPE